MTNLVQFPGLGLSFELDRVAFSIGGMNIYWSVSALPWACVWRLCSPSGTVWSSAWMPMPWWMSSSSVWSWVSCVPGSTMWPFRPISITA